MTRTPPAPGVVVLDGAGASVATVGGKGAWLDRLLAAGVAVPATAVVTTDAYRATAADPALAAMLGELERTAPVGTDAERAQVDDAFLAVALPDEVRAAIEHAAAAARSEAALLAVRSSATVEDMAATSFAGQYRSFLEVGDDAAVERAVRLVWASLWHPAPRAYRQANGVDEHDLAMAVVVMAMVPAVRAGVAFTVDPGGAADAVRVEVVEGYAEGLVSGTRTPDVHLVPRDERARGAAARGDVDPVVAEAAEVALAVEAAFGSPQDVEWAWDGERIRVVQARPITTAGADRDPFDRALATDRAYTTTGVAEMLPGVLPPLWWDVGAFAVEEGFRSLLDQLGALPAELEGPHGLVVRVRGRAVLDLTHLREVAGALPGGDEAEVDEQYFGRATEGRAAPAHPSGRGWRAVSHDLRVLRARRRALREAQVCEVAVDALLDRFPGPVAVEVLDEPALWHLSRRLLDLLVRVVAAEMAVAAAGVAAYRRLELLLLRHLDAAEAAAWAQRLTTRSGPHAGWSEAAVATLRARVDEVGGRVAAEVLATEPEWARACTRLAATAAGAAARAEVERALWRAGSAAVPGGTAWWEDPQPVWDLLRTAHRDRRPAEVGRWDDLAAVLTELPGWRRHRMLTGGLVDARLSGLRRAADDAADLLVHREAVKADVLAVGGVLRAVHLELGRRLVAAGSLAEPGDVDLLTLSEVAAAVAATSDLAADPPGATGLPTAADLARRRHWRRTHEASPALPTRWWGEPVVAHRPLPDGDVLLGWGAGPGVARGVARVLASPSGARLDAGDVLVARSTDASWSPLFLRAAAIVVEEGGPLSHAAIVARELAIPAVLNVPGIVDRLRAEQGRAADVELTVDGDQGAVVIRRPAAVGSTLPEER